MIAFAAGKQRRGEHGDAAVNVRIAALGHAPVSKLEVATFAVARGCGQDEMGLVAVTELLRQS